MRARKWLWRTVGALCALAVLVGWLARPNDPYAAFRRLGARDVTTEGSGVRTPDKGAHIRIFCFRVPFSSVEAVLPPYHPGYYGDEFHLPSGHIAMLVKPGANTPFMKPGDTCAVVALESAPRPWYVEAWQTLRRRLGL